MKLGSKMLAKLIREAIADKKGAKGPKTLAEVVQQTEPIQDFSHGGGKTYEAINEIKDDWLEMGLDDPSIQATAEELGVDPVTVWEVQVDSAAQELEERWAQVYNEVQDKLVNGDFFPRHMRRGNY